MEPLIPEMEGKVKSLFLFGEAGPALFNTFHGRFKKRVKLCETLEEAFWMACKDSSPGDVVLLSPGGSSFDEFGSYVERGEFFKDLVRAWKEKMLR